MSELAPAEAAPARRNWATVAAIVAVTLAVIAVTLLAVVMQRRVDNNSGSSASSLFGPTAAAARKAAASEVAATLTYNYKTLQADFARAEQGMTPAFRTTYQQTTADSVSPLATKYKATSSATVIATGVSAVTPNSATVLVFANQIVDNTQLRTNARLDRTRIRASLVLQNGKWLISNLIPI
jgi:Mce-associated membrane protein